MPGSDVIKNVVMLRCRDRICEGFFWGQSVRPTGPMARQCGMRCSTVAWALAGSGAYSTKLETLDLSILDFRGSGVTSIYPAYAISGDNSNL